ncbi:MAG: HAMP domain-containing sensor histidine kinase [Myxococcota bacterium]
MRVGYLALKIYLYSVVTGLVTIAIFIASFHILMASDRSEPPFMLDQLVTDRWQRRTEPTIAQEHAHGGPFPGPQVTIYDVEGRLISSSTARPPPPMLSESQLRRLEQVGQLELDRDVVVRAIRENGRVVGIGIVNLRPPPPSGLPPGLALPLAVLALVFLMGTVVFARHVAKPLEQLANTAKKFGRGELGARSRLNRKDEIGDLGHAFDDMAERVTSLLAVQQELLVNVSHELLTPLARIQVAVDLITDGEAAQAKEMVSEITHDLVELERLLDDVMTVAKLDLSRLKDGTVMPIELANISVEDVVQKAVSRFRARWTTHEVAVDIPQELPTLSADAVLLRRVLENLLDNARKYSETGTTIHIRAAAAEGSVSIEVADNGIGIEEADLKRVFTPFFRGDKSRSRSSGGVGLGLALARRVAEAHCGSIAIANKPDRGTTVTLTLPVQATRS